MIGQSCKNHINEINGLLKHEDRICSFSFANGILSVRYVGGITYGCQDDVLTAENIITSEDAPHFYGITNDTRQKIVFFIRGSCGFNLAYNVNTHKYIVNSYILYEVGQDILPISSIRLTGKEVDYFFPYGAGVYEFKGDKLDNIKFPANTGDKTKSFSFTTDTDEYCCSLEIWQTTDSFKSIKSYPCFFISFPASVDFIIVENNYRLVRSFFQFICNRKNIYFDSIKLYGTNENGKRTLVAKMCFPEDIYNKPETDEVLKKTITYPYLESHIIGIFKALIEEIIPFYNIPLDNESRKIIDYAKFISNLSVFEWTYRLNFEDSISEKRKAALNAVLTDLQEMGTQKNYSGKKKEELRQIIKYLTERLEHSNTSLAVKIKKSLDETKEILEMFIKHIYSMNDKMFNDEQYQIIAEYLSQQRNDFAHGNFAKEYNYDALFDLMIIEWLNYSLLLRYIGYSDDEIFNIINCIFNRGFVPK